MKQVFTKQGDIVVEDVPLPECNPSEILVANKFSVISKGTEIARIRGSKENLVKKVIEKKDARKKGIELVRKKGIRGALEELELRREKLLPLGYSSSGYVIKKGKNVTKFKIGDRVACGGVAYHAEVVAVPQNLVVPVPAEVSLKDASLSTLGSIAVQSLRRASCQFGEYVVIIGTGLIGSLAIQIAKAAGYIVIGIDISPIRLKLAKEFGADYVFDFYDENLLNEITVITEGHGADAAIIYASSPSSEIINHAMKMVRKRGRVVIVGSVGLELRREEMYKKELDVVMSTSYGPGRYDPLYEEKGLDYPISYVRWTENRNMKSFLQLLKEKKINVDKLVKKIYPIERATEAYAALKQEDILSVILEYQPKRFLQEEQLYISRKVHVISSSQAKTHKDVIGVGIIGVGSFARNMILPTLRKIPEFKIMALASKHGYNITSLARHYKIPYVTTNYQEILDDPQIDLVVIATRHNLHAQLAIDSIKAGKVTFVEKPLCLNENELENIISTVKAEKMPLFVGFNRRYSPFIQKIKHEITASQYDKPIIINYNVNAPFVPPESWIQDREIGGGRVIGEACHFLDLFNYLTAVQTFKDPKVTSIRIDGAQVVSNDNFTATIEWGDNALTTLTYTTLGTSTYPKEEITIFTGGNVYKIIDFKEFIHYRNNKVPYKETLKQPDKGHFNQFKKLAKFMKGEKTDLISFEDIVLATELSFIIDKKTLE